MRVYEIQKAKGEAAQALKMRKFDEAADLYGKLAEAEPTNRDHLYGLGQAQIGLRQFGAARETADQLEVKLNDQRGARLRQQVEIAEEAPVGQEGVHVEKKKKGGKGPVVLVVVLALAAAGAYFFLF